MNTGRNLLRMLQIFISFVITMLLTVGQAKAVTPEVLRGGIEKLAGSAQQKSKPPTKVQQIVQGNYSTTHKTAVDTPMKSTNRDGTLRSLLIPHGSHIKVPGAPAGKPEEIAHAFLKQNAAILGAESADVGFVKHKKRTGKGRNSIKFEQHYKGVPVFAAEVLVQVNDEDGIEYLAGGISRDRQQLDSGTLSLKPALSSIEAIAVAINELRKNNSAAVVTAKTPRLVIFDPAVLDLPGSQQLAWHFKVESKDDPLLDTEFVLNAHNGNVIRAYQVYHPLLWRSVYDAANTTADPGTLMRFEGSPASTLAEVNNAYDFIGQTYNYYANIFTGNILYARDGIDDRGSDITATVRACIPGERCPTNNAYGGGLHMLFGDGWAVDDAVAHEYTHGVTSYESALLYENASGAINEALSDIFGEFVDFSNNPPGPDSNRWRLGEDIASSTDNGIRDMSDPTLFLDPDRLSSPYYVQPTAYPEHRSNDNGGVHTNSGIINKMAFLLTDGGFFNGWSVYGMGENNVAALFYDANMHTLFSTAGYADLCYALLQSAGSLGWAQEDRNNVYRACNAVEIYASSPNHMTYVNWGCSRAPGFGTSFNPYCKVSSGVFGAPSGDIVKIWPGTYAETLDIDKGLILENWDPAQGEVILGP